MRRRLLNQQAGESDIPKAGTYYHKKTGEIEVTRSSNNDYDYDGVVVSDGETAFVVGTRIFYCPFRNEGTKTTYTGQSDIKDGSINTAFFGEYGSETNAIGLCRSQFQGRGYVPSRYEMNIIRNYVTEIDQKRRDLHADYTFGDIYVANRKYQTCSIADIYNLYNVTISNSSGYGTSLYTYNNYLIPVCSIKDYSKEYFKIIGLDINGLAVKFYSSNSSFTRTIEISTDAGKTWTSKTSSTSGTTLGNITKVGQEIWIRGNNSTYSTSSSYYTYFSATKSIMVSGNSMSLLYGDDFYDKTTLPDGSTRTFYKMFYNCSYLMSARDLILPETSLTEYCYGGMFQSCSRLIYAPKLPATSLWVNCYNSMFYGCSRLWYAPELPATTLKTNCYAQMFYSCNNLKYLKCLSNNISNSSYVSQWLPSANSSYYAILETSASSISNLGTYWVTIDNGKVPIRWSKTSLSIKTDGSGPLFVNPFLIPAEELSISSSNTSVATVTGSGAVTIKNAGSCTLSATYNGHEYSDYYSKTCGLTVTAYNPQFNSISVTNVSNGEDFVTSSFGNHEIYYAESSVTFNSKIKIISR